MLFRSHLPGGGGTQRLPRLIPLGAAYEHLLLGQPIPAADAFRLGLVNHVVPHAELLPYTRQLAADCRTIDQVAVRRMLSTYDRNSLVSDAEAWQIEDEVSRNWEGSGFDPAEIEKRRARAREQGGAEAVAKQHARGRITVRETANGAIISAPLLPDSGGRLPDLDGIVRKINTDLRAIVDH